MLKKLKIVNGGFEDENKFFYETKADYLCTGVLGLCGCGDPKAVANYIKNMFLKHVQQAVPEDHSCWDRTYYEDLPAMFFLLWANNHDYIEHGTTIRCSWMTEKGIELLKDLIQEFED